MFVAWMERLGTDGLRVERGVYDLRLDGTGRVQGTAIVDGRALGSDVVAFATSPGLTITKVEVDGAAIAAVPDADGVWSVAAHGSPGRSHRVHVVYEGRLTRAFMRDVAGYAWYELQSMTGWHPRFAVDEQWSSRLSLTVPATFGAVSSFGLVEQARTSATIRYVWDTGDATCDDFSVVVGEGLWGDDSSGPVELRALCQRTSPCTPDGVLAAGAAAVQAYSGWWGPCPYQRVTLACLPHASCGNCSREGLVLFGELHSDPANAPDAFGLVAHEVCHMWWGWGVRFDEDQSLGYVEALAHYGDERLMRDRFGESAFRRHISEYLLPNAKAAEAVARVSLRDCRYSTPESSRLRQRKGAAVMLLLERLIGRKAMDAALSTLLAEFLGKTAGPAEVRRAFMEVGGTQCEGFFDNYFDGVVPIPMDPTAYGE